MKTATLRRPATLGPTDRPMAPVVDDAMARYARGDDDAFASVYDFVAPRVTAYLRRRVRDESRVPDLVQQTFLHVHRARHTFVPGAQALPWAFAIARRQLVDAYRAALREPFAAGDEPRDGGAAAPDAGAELFEGRDALRCLELALARLSVPQRAAFELVKRDGLSLVEAAARLGTTVTAVKLRTHRAYKAIRAALNVS
jgi:RNA polymerase sigma-70 factor, ECF subfamily